MKYSPQGDAESYGGRGMRHTQSIRAPTAERETDKYYLQQDRMRNPNCRNYLSGINQQTLDGFPMSAASERPEEDIAPSPYERKRNGTPSMLESVSAKRHQTIYEGGDFQAFQRAPENMGQSGRRRSPIDNRQVQYVDELTGWQYSAARQTGFGVRGVDIEDSPLSRKLDPSFWENKPPSNQERFLNDRAAPVANEKTRYIRAQTQERCKQQWDYEAELERRSESRPHRRFSSAVPEVFRDHMERGQTPEQQFQQYPVQAARLRSAIWAEQRQPPQYAISVAGNYVPTKAGNAVQLPHPQSEQSRSYELDPRTPDNHRARGQSVAPHTPASHRGRSSSHRVRADRGSRSRSRSVTQPQPNSTDHRERSKSVYHTPLPAVALALSTPESTPKQNRQAYAESLSDAESPMMMEDFFKKGRQSRMAQNTVKSEASRYDIRDELREQLPQNNMFANNTRRPQASMVQTPPPNARRHLEQEVIDLISPEISNSMRPPPTPVRSIPMRDRIAPAKRPSGGIKASLSKPNVATQSKPKLGRSSTVEILHQDMPSAEFERQRKLAERILEKEEDAKKEALQLEIFGEVLPEDSDTKKKREEKERAENQRKREEAQTEKLMKQEEKRVAELGKVRLREEAAEKARIVREIEEAKNKVRRDAERKKREAAEAQQTERLRQQAEERIQAEREKKATEDAERGREKPKAASIQVQAEAMAEIKAKQEEAKKQAASLSFPKLASSGDIARFAADNSEVADTENPLFVRDDSPKLSDDPIQESTLPKSYGNQYNVYDIDERAAKKPNGPTTAAEAMKFHNSREGTSNYRIEREAFEAERALERVNKTKAALDNRWARTKSTQPEPSPPQKTGKTPQPPRPVSSMLNPNMIRNSSTSKPTTAHNRLAKRKSSAFFRSTTNTSRFGSGSTKRPNANFRKQHGPSSVCSSSASESVANIIADPQQQKRVREQGARDQEDEAIKDRQRKDASNARARKKADERARERQRLKIIEAAEANGRGITDEDLDAELEAFMEEREKKKQKVAMTHAQKDQRRAMFPPMSSFLQGNPQPQPPPQTFNQLDSNDEDDTPEGQDRRENRAAVRKTLNATAQQRNAHFNEVAAKKYCRFFGDDDDDDARGRDFLANINVTPPPNPYPSSEESEEDPDDDPLPEPSKPTSAHASQAENDDQESSDWESEPSEEDLDDEPAEGLPRPNPTASNDLDVKVVEGIKNLSTHRDPPTIPTTATTASVLSPETESETIYEFTVHRQDRKNGKDRPPISIGGPFFDRTRANKFARDFLHKRQKKHPVVFREKYDRHEDLYSGDVDWDEQGRESVMVYITKQLKCTKEVSNFTLAEYRSRFPRRFYIIKQALTHLITDERTGRVVEGPEKENILEDEEIWVDITLANNEACERFINFLNPGNARYDDVRAFKSLEVEVVAECQKGRDEANREKRPFSAEVEPDDGLQMPWLAKKFRKIRFYVEAVEIQGPLN